MHKALEGNVLSLQHRESSTFPIRRYRVVTIPLIDGDAAVEGEPEGDGVMEAEPEGDGVMLALPVEVAPSAY